MSSRPALDQDYETAPAVPRGDRIVLALAALLLAVQVSPWYYSQRDAAAYISIARNLSHGAGLSNMGSPVLWFPPGYPAILSPLFHLRDLPLLEISIVHFLLGVGFLWGTYRWARPLAPAGAVWIAAISVGTTAVWIQYRRPMSEMAFMAVMVWLLVSINALARVCRCRVGGARKPCGDGALREPFQNSEECSQGLGSVRNPPFPWRFAPRTLQVDESRRRYLAWLAIAVVLAVVLCLIRPVGIALAAGGSCELLANAVRRRRSSNRSASEAVSWWRTVAAAAVVSAAAAITVGWFIGHERWAAQPLGAWTYLNSLEARRSPALAGGYWPWCALVVSEIGRITVPGMFKSYGPVGSWRDVNMLIYVPCCGLLLYGYFRWIRRSHDPLAWSLPFYLAVLTYFRWESGARWWVPMTPALFMCLWFVLDKDRRVSRHLFLVLWLLHVLAGLAYWIGVDLPRARALEQKWPVARRLAEKITSDRDQVLIEASMLDDMGMLLDLQLDRRVKGHKGDAPIPTPARWLIVPIQQEPPPGFAVCSVVNECQLLHRD